jgi:hypothetical protein
MCPETQQFWHTSAALANLWKERISQGNGPIRHVETCPDFFFTARVHTTKSTVKIFAANTHCKYFLKIVEVTHFFCTRNGLYQRFVQPLLALTGSLTLGTGYERSYHSLLGNKICYNGHTAHTYLVRNTSFTSSTFHPQ